MRWLAMAVMAVGLGACSARINDEQVKLGSGPYTIEIAATENKGQPEAKEVVLRVRHKDGRETAAIIQGGASSLLEPAQAQALLQQTSERVVAAPDDVEKRVVVEERRVRAQKGGETTQEELTTVRTEAEPGTSGERVRVRLPGINIEANEGGESGDRARVSIGFGADRIEVQAVDLDGKANAVIKLRGDAKLVRSLLEDQEELSPEVRAQMLQALGLTDK